MGVKGQRAEPSLAWSSLTTHVGLSDSAGGATLHKRVDMSSCPFRRLLRAPREDTDELSLQGPSGCLFVSVQHASFVSLCCSWPFSCEGFPEATN